MIVECKSCLTKFRVADDKISARGIKVRCSKCQHTFMVRKDEAAAEPAAAAPSSEDATKVSKPPVVPQTSRTMQMYAVSPADIRTSAQAASFDLDGGVSTDPFSVPDTQAARRAGFDDAALPPTNPLGPSALQRAPQAVVATTGEATRRLTAPPPGPDPFAALTTERRPAPEPRRDPFAAREDLFGGAASFDQDDLPPAPWGAGNATASAAAASPDPFAATAAGPPPALPAAAAPGADPFTIPPTAAASSAAGARAAFEQPTAPGPDPFSAMGPPPVPPGNGGSPDPFALAATAGLGPALNAPPGLGAGPDPLGLPAGARPIEGSPEDIFGNLGGPPPIADDQAPWDAGAAGGGFNSPLDAETRVRTVDDDMLKMLANYSQAEQAKPEPELAAGAAPVSTAKAKAERSTTPTSTGHPLLWHVVQGLLGLVLASGVLLGVYSFRGGRFDDVSPGHLFSVVLFGEQTFEDSNLQTGAVDVTVYPLRERERVVVVTGQVLNHGGADLPGVVVRGTLRDGEGQDVGSGEIYAGAVLDPFDLVRARDPRQLAARVRERVARAGSALAPGQSWPFSLVIAPQGDPDLTRTVVELDLRPADAPRAGASSEPAAEASDGSPATPAPGSASPVPGPAGATSASASSSAAPGPGAAATKPAPRPATKAPAKPVVKPARKPAPAAEDGQPPPPPPPPPPAG